MKYINTFESYNIINELFDGNEYRDADIEIVTNTNFKVEFHYIDPVSGDLYEFDFIRNPNENEAGEFTALFSKNDEYQISNDNTAHKIFSIVNKVIGMFIELKPEIKLISYKIDRDEIKRKNIYNAIFLKHGFKEKSFGVSKLNSSIIVVKLESNGAN